MNIDAKFEKQVISACNEELKSRGFREIRKGWVALDISDDFLGWVGLNSALRPGLVRVNPFAGVHCISVIKRVDEISGERYQRGRFATFSFHLGEKCPEVPVFEFRSQSDLESEAVRLASTYEQCAVPVMRAMADLLALLPLLQSKVEMAGGYPERVAVTLYLLGRREEALEFIERLRYEYRSDRLLLSHFEKFACPFVEKLQT